MLTRESLGFCDGARSTDSTRARRFLRELHGQYCTVRRPLCAAESENARRCKVNAFAAKMLTFAAVICSPDADYDVKGLFWEKSDVGCVNLAIAFSLSGVRRFSTGATLACAQKYQPVAALLAKKHAHLHTGCRLQCTAAVCIGAIWWTDLTLSWCSFVTPAPAGSLSAKERP